MGDQVGSAVIAVLAGCLLAVVLFVPFVFVNYRRHGRLSLGRVVLWIGFLVYVMALWTYTLLPLPDPGEIRCTSTQLRPFQFLTDIGHYDTSPRGLVHNPALMQAALNIMLFMPLGFFFRVLWGRGIAVTTLAGGGLSLLIETTQVTGVWWLYPCAYRVFDVDDLLANTSGAFLGAVFTALLLALRHRVFPADHPRKKSGGITAGRRLTAMVCDGLSMILLGVATGVASNAWQVYVLGRPSAELNQAFTEQLSLWVPFAVLGVVTLTTGGTVGDHAVRLRYAPRSHNQRVPAPSTLSPVLTGIRYLAGIGGFQLLSLLSPADLVFVVLSLVAIFLTGDRRGLPGLLSGTALRDNVVYAGDTDKTPGTSNASEQRT